MRKLIIGLASLGLVFAVTGCGGGGESHADNVREMTGNTLCDPYIVGAVMFEDMNGDGTQDAGDQVSTASATDGTFSFTNPLTVGSILRMTATTGTHNGYAFDGGLTRKVEAGDTTAGVYLAVTPFTTLINNGWTEQNIIDVLAEGGLTGIIVEDLRKDPMGTFNLTDTVGSINDAKLERLRASICIYNLLSVVNALNLGADNYDLTYEKFSTHPQLKSLMTNMVQQVKAGLSKETMEQIQARIEEAKGQCPWTVADVTIEDIIKGSVAIADFVIGKTVTSCHMSNDKNGDGYPDCDYNAYTQSSADFAEWKNELGESFYVIRTATNQCTQYAAQNGMLPNVLTKTKCKLVDGSPVTVSCE